MAAPLDALHARFQTNDLLFGRYPDMWRYAWRRTLEMGFRGVFAGWSLSWVKDGFGCAVFFCTFESVKNQAFYGYISHLYRRQSHAHAGFGEATSSAEQVVRPHFAIEPAFLLLAGIAASVAQSLVQYPLGLVQELHLRRLAVLDRLARRRVSTAEMLNAYWLAYRRTFKICTMMGRQAGGLSRWLFQGYGWNTLRQIPSTSAGLIIFELVRRRYADDKEATILKVDSRELLLT